MNRRASLGGLVIVNAVLVVVLSLLSFSTPDAGAQGLGARGADYIMVAGRVSGRTESAVFITDKATGALVAVQYDNTRRVINATAGRDVASDFRAARGGR
jgi:hypothetical protein